MKRKELLREDIIKEKVKGGDCKTMPDKLYNILYEKSKVYGVRVLYEEDFPLDELTEFIQQEIDRAREDTEVDRIKWALRELPKLTEGKDFREDNWSVIVEKLKTKLTK